MRVHIGKYSVVDKNIEEDAYLGGQHRKLSRLLLSPTKAKKMVVAQKRKKKVENTMNIATDMQSTPEEKRDKSKNVVHGSSRRPLLRGGGAGCN